MKNPVPTCVEFRQALKVVTVAQFLKYPASASYQKDDGSFLADFLDHTVGRSPDEPECEVIDSAVDHLENELSLTTAEANCVYYLGGYCIKNVQRSACPHCLESVVAQNTSHAAQETLCNFKEYKGGALVLCSHKSMELITQAEQLFRKVESSLHRRLAAPPCEPS